MQSYLDGNGIYMDPDVGVVLYRTSDGSTKTFVPANIHTGNFPAYISTYGNDTTPVITETYICQLDLPHAASITGIAIFNGSVASGNIKVGLADDAGLLVAQSASTAMAGTDAYQRVPFTTVHVAKGGTYYVLLQVDNTTARFNTHTLNNCGASKKTGETYGTFTTITAPTTFTANVGPVASLY